VRARRLRPITCAALIAALGLAEGHPVRAEGTSCDLPANVPVSLIVLQSERKVQELAASVRNASIVRGDRETVIFDDGRVITADVSAAGDHLNELGWGNRRIEFAVSFPRRRRLPKRAVG
jgi:hypothetical protein